MIAYSKQFQSELDGITSIKRRNLRKFFLTLFLRLGLFIFNACVWFYILSAMLNEIFS